MLLDHEITGSGPGVVLLHAGVADRRMWEHQRDVLAAAGYRVLCPDLRGYGGTPAATTPYDEAADVRDLVDRLGLGRFALVGASAGGSVALQLAARWPHRVLALVLLCPAAPGLEPSAELRGRWRAEGELLDDGDVAGAVALNVSSWLGPEADDAARTLVTEMQQRAFELQLVEGAVEADDADVDLADVTAPTLAVSGDLDLSDFAGVADRVAAAVPGAERVRLAGVGHLPSLERPDATASLVRDFLLRHVPTGGS
ncbi:alpha/beta fold hydrolase [Georgenia subflava]|uniref:Alpha/beta fold hydrolase n=1 Tax=Georgenia subflava TaxID=1622177 RepID=A0A6N7EFT1_9MICO|nr:alpha/beta hydrolase [Georgenia subflava]MPV36979.1 alpha/beta fold hydrolase [Georgenia subflava]